MSLVNLHSLLYYLSPFKSLSYVHKFVFTSIEIATHQRLSRRRIRIAQALLLLKCLHYLLLHFHPTDLIEFVTFFDDAALFKAQRGVFQLVFLVNGILSVYGLEDIYLHPKLRFVAFIKDIFIDRRSKYFAGSKDSTFQEIHLFARVLIAFTQVYFLTVELFVLYIEQAMLQVILHHHFFLTLFGLLQLVLLHTPLALLTLFFFVAFCQSLTIVNILLTTSLKCLFIKGRQNLRLLLNAKSRSIWNLSTTIQTFQKSQVELLQLVTLVNRFSCRFLFAYLLVNIPMNAFLIGLLIDGHITEKNAFFMSILVLSQFNGIFGIHLFAAVLCRVIHAPSKALLTLAAQIRSGNVPLKLQVDRLVAAWHTRQPYGMTYGKYGLVSVKAFYKYLFLYGKFLMISFKMLHIG